MRIATPYSHLFTSVDIRRTILGLSDLAEIRSPDQLSDLTPSVLWHCDLSIVRQWTHKHFDYLSSIVEGLRTADVTLEVASFHAPSRYVANDVVNGVFVGRGEPMGEGEMLAHAESNATTIRDMLRRAGYLNVQLLVENNNHLGTNAYEVVTTPEFISKLLYRSDFGLLLDVAHARITAANTGEDEQAYFEKLPLEQAVQIHLSRHSVLEDRSLDSHDALEDDDWSFFQKLAPKLPKLSFATIEYYKDANILAELIKRLRKELEVYGNRGDEAI
jgi:hypothetical protein